MNLVPRNQNFDFDSIFNDFFHGFRLPHRHSGESEPLAGMRVDVHEADDSYEIHAELPGVKKDDIEITLQNDILTVSASKETEAEKKKKGKVIWKERSSGSISRSFNVTPGTTQQDISANFADGVLTLSVPKSKPSTEDPGSRRIPIA
ncbi:MAG: Hsp20 family protein [Pseudomonadales bacterium]|nr:Hsp20 family protein [Pseudomonadales bacterium]